MSDQEQQVQLESKASPELQAEASGMGWISPDRFKGDPEKFVDADTYVERGKHLLPILNATNDRLRRENEQTKAELRRLETAFIDSQEAIKSLKEYQNEETQRQVTEAKKALLKEITKAREDGDVELEVELQSSLSDLKTAVKEAPKQETQQKQQQQQAAHPDWGQWMSDNPWFGVDQDLTALTADYAQRLRRDPANNALVGKAFFDKAAESAKKVLHKQQERQSSKVEGSGRGSSSSSSSGSSSGKTFRDLPSDARAACEDPKRLKVMVGPGKAFKDKAEWQSHYVETYFQGE